MQHWKMLQRFPDGFFLFQGYLRLRSTTGFGEVVALAHIQAAFALDLGDIQAGHFQSVVVDDIRLDFGAGRF